MSDITKNPTLPREIFKEIQPRNAFCVTKKNGFKHDKVSLIREINMLRLLIRLGQLGNRPKRPEPDVRVQGPRGQQGASVDDSETHVFDFICVALQTVEEEEVSAWVELV